MTIKYIFPADELKNLLPRTKNGSIKLVCCKKLENVYKSLLKAYSYLQTSETETFSKFIGRKEAFLFQKCSENIRNLLYSEVSDGSV